MPDPIKDNERLKLRIDAFKERLKKREIWINGPINESLVEVLYTNLVALQEQSQQSPITVVINSLGGNLFESIVATDIMGTSPCPITTIGLANIVSGGFIIFMGGEQRICHDYSQIMMHSAAFTANDKVSDIATRVEYIDSVQEKMAKLFAYQTGNRTTQEYWLELFKSGKDKWFSIEEALKLGIIHKVIKRRELIDPNFNSRPSYTWDITDILRSQS
jgi:ATP-dependent Clp protease protease subunit